jgi:hypothetical protein
MRLNRDKTTLTTKRWAAYAAAGAAGAVAALGPQAADAEITVVDVGTTLLDANQGDGYFDIFGPYTFGAAGASFVFQQAFNETGTNVGQLVTIGNGNFTFIGFGAGPYFYPSNLAYGTPLSAGNFGVGAGNRGDMAWGAGYTNSQWLAAGTGYLGFRFDLGGGTQYGWAEVTVDGAPGNSGTFVRYGWGAVGDTVFAGQGPSVVPEPGSLGMLALGSIGLMSWRRKRSAA